MDDEALNLLTFTLASLEFFEPLPIPKGNCLISTDPTYGYTIENPIKVGGQVMSGPPREKTYLNALIGPNGEEITYERAGSLDSKDSIIDHYILTYLGLETPIDLYLDEYSFETLYAPMGLTCSSPFPVQIPGPDWDDDE